MNSISVQVILVHNLGWGILRFFLIRGLYSYNQGCISSSLLKYLHSLSMVPSFPYGDDRLLIHSSVETVMTENWRLITVFWL